MYRQKVLEDRLSYSYLLDNLATRNNLETNGFDVNAMSEQV